MHAMYWKEACIASLKPSSLIKRLWYKVGGSVIGLLTQTSFPLSGSMEHYLKHVSRQHVEL